MLLFAKNEKKLVLLALIVTPAKCNNGCSAALQIPTFYVKNYAVLLRGYHPH